MMELVKVDPIKLHRFQLFRGLTTEVLVGHTIEPDITGQELPHLIKDVGTGRYQ